MKPRNENTQEFPLAPLSQGVYWFFAVTWVFLLAAAFFSAYLLPHGDKPVTNFLPIWLVIPLVTTLILLGIYVSLRRRHIRLGGGTLTIAATLYTRKVVVSELDMDKARIVNLDEHVELKPALKLNGFGLPGFQAGHFRLRDRRRAFCLLTSIEKVLVLPLHDGKLVLLSPESPQTLLSCLCNLVGK